MLSMRRTTDVRPRRCGRHPLGERGASAVELALVLPVLVLLVGAIIDFGFLFSQQTALNTAARDAARSGVTRSFAGDTASCGTVAARARASSGGSAGALGLGDARTVLTVVNVVSGAVPATTTELCRMSGSASSGATTAKPCAGTRAGSRLQVVLTHDSKPPFPIPVLGTMTLTARGDFACEYS